MTSQAPVRPPKQRHWTEKLSWILIYAGLFTVVLGIATARQDEPLGWSIGVPGGVAVLAGVVLIYIRSRIKP
ncbi:MAG: hypothetical protein ACLGJD_08125 [Gammaproteobacteria bacterium]|uniref:hypothetical protein n=1 Tax=Pseudacidovorax sp. 1753 TaxID=3156419 RepID=UPI0025F7A4A0|nr:hypothetical protein [uncultured Pseudacidovorax sp.]